MKRSLFMFVVGMLLCGVAGGLMWMALTGRGWYAWGMAALMLAGGISLTIIVHDGWVETAMRNVRRAEARANELNLCRVELASTELRLRAAERRLRHLQQHS